MLWPVGVYPGWLLLCSFCFTFSYMSNCPRHPVPNSTPFFFALTGLSHFPTLYYSGVKNADEAELRQVASEPVDLNVYNVNDFPLLSKLVGRLVHILCGRIEERGISKRNSIRPVVFSLRLIRRVSSNTKKHKVLPVHC